jgi:hypothetical protein
MDDATRKSFDMVGQRLDSILSRMDKRDDMMTGIVSRLERQDLQLAAIVTRLEEQDGSHDRLMGKVDRLGTKIDHLSVLARAGEEAMTSLDALSRRVAKIEAAMRGNGKDT